MTFVRPSVVLNGHRLAMFAGASLAVGLLVGCGGGAGVRSASAATPDARLGKAEAKAERALARAEAALAKAPDNVAARVALGQAYLAAGRFESAGTALDDAMSLGENSGRTALALALARIGSGRPREAVAILEDWRGEIPASDLGLALALAGETARGVAILTDAVRSGDATPKLRQNLAYAYALDGRWAEARLMAAQDIPADQLERRLAFWALSMLPDRNGERVAALIGAPARQRDPGLPAALALRAETQPALAAAEVPSAVPAASVEPSGELAAAPAVSPPMAVTAPVVATNLAAQQQVAAQVARPAPARAISVAQAFGSTTLESRPARAVPVRAAPVPVRRASVAVANPHAVQLGAFSSPQGARRAVSIFKRRDPALAGRELSITPAVVNGKSVWRVAAVGISGRVAATSLCAKVKAGGGACFAYATQRFPTKAPGVPATGAGGVQRARR